MQELARIETVVVLQAVELFSACSAEQILRISGIARQRRFEPAEKIYNVNDSPQALYSVVRGGVTLTDGNGHKRTVGPLESFGVSEILSGRLRGGTAIADENTLVLAIDAEDFFDLLANNIEIVKALFRQILSSTALPGETGS